MNIDERLERLADRHEALTQSIEITAGMQRENEKQIFQLATFIRQRAEIAKRHEDRLDNLEH